MSKVISFPTVLILIFVIMNAGCKKPQVEESLTCICNFVDSSHVHPKAADYQAIIDKYTTRGLPGISLLIRDENGEWLGVSGYADIEKSVKMEKCHVSKIASITKTFIGVAVLLLMEEGQIALDNRISEYLSSETLKNIKNADQATIRNLLNHTSGIYDVISGQGFYLELLNKPEKNWKPEELLDLIRKKDAAFEINTTQGYSNSNYLLLSMIIDEVTGSSHANYLKEKIFDPLGLSDTYYYWHHNLPSHTAQGYYDLYNTGNVLNMSNYNTGSGNGYGGIYSSTKDMQRFIEALFRDKILLTENGLNQMMTYTDIDGDNNRRFGLGIFKDFLEKANNNYGVGHRGRDLAYSADLFWFPEKDVTLSYFVNYGTNGETELRKVFFDFRDEISDAILK